MLGYPTLACQGRGVISPVSIRHILVKSKRTGIDLLGPGLQGCHTNNRASGVERERGGGKSNISLEHLIYILYVGIKEDRYRPTRRAHARRAEKE